MPESAKKTQMLVRVSDRLARLMKVLAASRGASLSATAERAFEDLLAKEGVDESVLPPERKN